MISATIIADSITPTSTRLTTFVLKFPRIILAEFNTHRMFSRNSSSSRAIPFKKMVKLALTEPFIPKAFQKDHSGMQGAEYLDKTTYYKLEEFLPALSKIFDKDEDEDILEMYNNVLVHKYKNVVRTPEGWWLIARDNAVECALMMNCMGVTKQICNRLLEPFMYHTVICTASDYENFFALRVHEAAEIHIQELAEKMLAVYNASTPKRLKQLDWHIPFGDQFDQDRLSGMVERMVSKQGVSVQGAYNMLKVKIATARCARVSYMNFDGNDDYEADIKLHDNLATMGHMSPFEHCARVMDNYEWNESMKCEVVKARVSHELEMVTKCNHGWSGNFRGFLQYRKMFENENREDVRVLAK